MKHEDTRADYQTRLHEAIQQIVRDYYRTQLPVAHAHREDAADLASTRADQVAQRIGTDIWKIVGEHEDNMRNFDPNDSLS